MTNFVANYIVLLICAGYGVAGWVMQLYRVAPPRDWLVQRIWYVKAQIAAESWKIGAQGQTDLDEVLRSVQGWWARVPISKVESGWRNVHGLEDAHILELPKKVVNERLATARDHLATIPGTEAAAFVTRIKAALKEKKNDDARQVLLQEASVFRHNVNDTNYENLATILGKAVWLTWVALAIIVALTWLFDRETFFLLGAAGGLISRLTRVLEKQPSSTDYGAEWSTLILSPAAGALAGWVGVAICSALANAPFNVMSDHFASPWAHPAATLGLLVAFVFGFSERLFNRLLGVAVDQVGGKLPADAKPA